MNAQLKKLTAVSAVIILVFTALCGVFFGLWCAVFALAGFVTLSAVFIGFTAARLAEIRRLSDSLDRILHGMDTELICDSAEGELSVLQSEIRKMTVRLKESADRLSRDKLHLTDSIADISHQLRTPLTSMNIVVSMLAGESDDRRRLELTRSLKQMLMRIDWLIETLLKLSKIDAGAVRFDRSRVSVRELAERAAKPLEASLDVRSQRLEISVADEWFEGDLPWSAEALSNILKNCMEHTPQGGAIYVGACRRSIYTEITVRDEGGGIDPADLPNIFERFYKGKNSSDGSVGIGLALARSIIVSQNGTVKAENAPEGGALFTVRFYFGAV